MKKILHIVEAYGGGVFTVLTDLLNELANIEEYEIVLAYSKRPQTPNNYMELIDSRIRLIEINNFVRNINPIKDIKAFIEIKQIIKKENPDIIHLHSSKAGVIGRVAANGKKYRMFYNPHGFSFLKQDDSKLKRIIYRLIEKLMVIINPKCTIIGCSKGEYHEAQNITLNSICINNGINVEKFSKEIEKLPVKEINDKALKICTSGRIDYQKNPDFFNYIAHTYPNITFTWIGDGYLREKLNSKNIYITGWKTRGEVLEIINNNDIFLLTSLWEGMPIALLEAMFLKKTCVVTNCIGNRDVIKNNENGFIIEKNNFKKVFDNMNKDAMSRVAFNARNDVINLYSIKRMAKEYYDIYN